MSLRPMLFTGCAACGCPVLRAAGSGLIRDRSRGRGSVCYFPSAVGAARQTIKLRRFAATRAHAVFFLSTLVVPSLVPHELVGGEGQMLPRFWALATAAEGRANLAFPDARRAAQGTNLVKAQPSRHPERSSAAAGASAASPELLRLLPFLAIAIRTWQSSTTRMLSAASRRPWRRTAD